MAVFRGDLALGFAVVIDYYSIVSVTYVAGDDFYLFWHDLSIR
jgi:hypothetical protein